MKLSTHENPCFLILFAVAQDSISNVQSTVPKLQATKFLYYKPHIYKMKKNRHQLFKMLTLNYNFIKLFFILFANNHTIT